MNRLSTSMDLPLARSVDPFAGTVVTATETGQLPEAGQARAPDSSARHRYWMAGRMLSATRGVAASAGSAHPVSIVVHLCRPASAPGKDR
ncbi:hypothetical protein Ahu01nite_099410 [Winogradskya humida]|uniref:Uncharacterized protein n=1 Tax=Winogradskya humida TaxID=113566 RepID=A0ABQ4A7K5_9ACTN|nr:hypothetical protein Ahu01nite_099410 [Actinoplanes humidus]